MDIRKMLAVVAALITIVAVADSINASPSSSLISEDAAVLKTSSAVTDLNDDSFIQCAAITRKGTRCKRRATYGAYCWQHAR